VTYADRFHNFLAENLFTGNRNFPMCELDKNDKEGKNNNAGAVVGLDNGPRSALSK